MGDNLTRTDKAGCCGCLTGLIIGVILLVTVGAKNQSPEYFFLIPLFGLFFGIIPHSIFSHDKEVRFGAGCICYPVFIIAGIIAFYNDVMSVFWGVIIAIVIIILLHLNCLYLQCLLFCTSKPFRPDTADIKNLIIASHYEKQDCFVFCSAIYGFVHFCTVFKYQTYSFRKNMAGR